MTLKSIVLGALVAAAPVMAQQVLGPSAVGDQSGATVPRSAPAGFAAAGAPAAALTPPLAEWAGLEFRPHLHFTRAYNSDLKSASGIARATYTNTTAAGLLVDAGSRWQLDYSHSWINYSDPDFRDTTSDLLSLSGALARPAWGATLSERYAKTDTPLIETGRQTGQESSDTTGALNWNVGSNVLASVSGDQQLTFTKGLADIYQWTVRPSLAYELGRGANVAASLADGYVLMYHAADSKFLRPSVQASWQLTRITAAHAEIGWDHWSYVSGHRPDTSGLYYLGSLSYMPFEASTLSLSAQQHIDASPFRNETTRTQLLSAALQQRVLQHFQLALDASQQRTRYLFAALGGAIGRSDRVWTYGAALSTTLRRRGSISMYYRYSKDASSDHFFNFATHQMGLEIGFRY